MASSATVSAPKKRKSFSEYFHSMRGQQLIVTLVFLFVPLVLLFMFTYLPFFKMVEFSFFKMKYIGRRTFVGLQNYISVFTRKDCFHALSLSLYYMVGSVVQMALALLFATILSFKCKGSKFFRGALYFPCLICGISVGFIFKFFFTHGFVLDTLLSWVGFNVDKLPFWLRDESINNVVLVACSIWKYIGQNIVMFIGAIASVDPVLYEAAEIDGANAWHRFKDIILPSISTIVVLNLIISVSGALSAFEMPYVVTGGGFNTSTYFVVMDKIAHTDQKVGLASAMAVVLLLLIVIVTYAQKAVEKWLESEAERMNAIKMKRILINICKYVLLIFAAFVALVPIVSCIFTAFKTEQEYASTNVITLPKSFLNFDNFIIAWNKANMGKAFLNSFIILICVLAGSIMISAMLAYVLNRFKFPGNKLIRNLFTIATLIPGIASQVTVYQIMTALHLVNSMPGYIILMMGTDVITIYIFLQFFENLSSTLDESAILDGCTYFGVFFKILLPLLKPAIVTSAILKGVSTYNEYYMANLYLQDKTKYQVVATSLYVFSGPMGNQYNYICAGVIITIIPALIVFLLCQDQIYSGMAAGAVKG